MGVAWDGIVKLGLGKSRGNALKQLSFDLRFRSDSRVGAQMSQKISKVGSDDARALRLRKGCLLERGMAGVVNEVDAMPSWLGRTGFKP